MTPADIGAAAARLDDAGANQPKKLESSLPDLGITAAHGATPQALAEDVVSQLRHVLQTYAFGAQDNLAPDAVALGERLRTWLGVPDVARACSPSASNSPTKPPPLR